MLLPVATLRELLDCHATPGDEAEVRASLERSWRAAGWRPRRLGDYAVTATPPAAAPRRAATLLICAHMDAPGFAVDRLPPAAGLPGEHGGVWGLTTLGGANFEGASAAGVLKCAAGRLPVTIRKGAAHGSRGPLFACRADAGAPPALLAAVRHGDRVCFAGRPRLSGHRVCAPALDNRLGCWLLAALPSLAASWRPRCRLVLGATACEELGGFGAPVLARAVQPDITVVLDATYEAAAQRVRLGGGPVLTLSDASVVLSPARRDAVAAIFASAGVPLQTEVYNYSGTDARAFPHQGLTGPVLPLLLATRGNHTPCETADLRDAEALANGLRALAEGWQAESHASRASVAQGRRR